MVRSDSPSPVKAGLLFLKKPMAAIAGFARWARWYLLALMCSAAAFLFLADLRVQSAAVGGVYSDPATLPPVDAALVLGTAKYSPGGGENPYYTSRIATAARLFKEGRVRGIVVSGDNATTSYNEPQRMKEDITELGVPGEYVTCDYAGFRTLDSVIRMKAVFGLERYAIVTQEFHAVRALYLARAFGQDPVALATSDPEGGVSLRLRLREVFARGMAFLDVNIFGRGPKFLGEPVVVKLAPLSPPDEKALAPGVPPVDPRSP